VLLETDVSNNTQATYTQTPNLYGDLVSQRERPAIERKFAEQEKYHGLGKVLY